MPPPLPRSSPTHQSSSSTQHSSPPWLWPLFCFFIFAMITTTLWSLFPQYRLYLEIGARVWRLQNRIWKRTVGRMRAEVGRVEEVVSRRGGDGDDAQDGNNGDRHGEPTFNMYHTDSSKRGRNGKSGRGGGGGGNGKGRGKNGVNVKETELGTSETTEGIEMEEMPRVIMEEEAIFALGAAARNERGKRRTMGDSGWRRLS